RQDPVVGFVTDRDVPYVLGRFRAAQRVDGGVQEEREIRERHAVGGAGRAGQAGVQAATRCGSVCSSWLPGPKR
ncbi:hypothetical protein B5180_35860, partial [Streptomyces sp. BF-3]